MEERPWVVAFEDANGKDKKPTTTHQKRAIPTQSKSTKARFEES
jgi:hypothetical protein